MKSFSYDLKTGRYEYRNVGSISKDQLQILRYIKKNQFANHQDIEEMISEWTEDDQFQLSHDTLYHLTQLGLIEWKDGQSICVKYNVKDYKKSKYEKVTGYFLTENGRAFLNVLFPEPKKKKNVRR